ncbi:hypothetical protein RC156_003850 [Salmonella enterica]|uniref:Ead/Ea22-like family protein n=1 Tax=Salmonella montevideo TaxID=115981 RepID=A0A3V3HL78_SALMO|nr:hypothetical protein [Salmonella enterica]EAA1912792.1 hypothetical protein [Salmonella enterica subsp. enterica serovar Tennessee]EAO0022725.1 hypothetical protein [Salmonella enterica subsp. enterica serovar Amsterdam var. 15+,34+]EBA2371740.1 hypothetical protein [Salmonella enterica subsp. enterica serovar Dublin]EBK5871646.1 hypothetical protein [Salmonella enterica subsp. enterica serovar Amsterdam]ECB8561378.1 hypothetical protein [Salmonella enterica subsp. enterica serovar Anatum]
MQEVKIYTASPSDLSPPVQSESFCVDMVLASDYAELEEKFMALAVENELARKAVQAFCDVVGDNIEVISEEVGRDGVLVILEAMKATGNMPATDAFLAEVRAQGVEMFSEKFGGGTQLSDMVKEVAADFSAKLRKGAAQ